MMTVEMKMGNMTMIATMYEGNHCSDYEDSDGD